MECVKLMLIKLFMSIDADCVMATSGPVNDAVKPPKQRHEWLLGLDRSALEGF